MIKIFRKTQQEFSQDVQELLGKGKRHSEGLYAEWFRKGSITKEANWIEPQARKLVEDIFSHTDFSLPELALQKQEGETVKFLLKMKDGLETESVLIPMESGVTLCVSSQVGCRMGCAFCETGKMGLVRHLQAEEIVAQVFYVRHFFKRSVRNIVFMGMGEPLDNFDEVMRAINVLTDPAGMGFGPSRITVSTSGCVDGIYRLIEEADPALNLAVSVNAPTDEIRRKIMPVNKQWGMVELKTALLDYCSHPRRGIFAEYVMLKGINDSLEHADLLADYLSGLRVKVNIIPYNPQSKDRFSPPSMEEMNAFLQHLRGHGLQALLRHPKGQAIMAACGQLGNVKLRSQLAALKLLV
jgi:23S rRNA (adenine2503-C2)-methyltransferase